MLGLTTEEEHFMTFNALFQVLACGRNSIRNQFCLPESYTFNQQNCMV